MIPPACHSKWVGTLKSEPKSKVLKILEKFKGMFGFQKIERKMKEKENRRKEF